MHVHNGTGIAFEEEGADLAWLTCARAWAVEGRASIISEEARQGMVNFRRRAEIAMEGDELVGGVPFAQAFERHLPGGDAE